MLDKIKSVEKLQFEYLKTNHKLNNISNNRHRNFENVLIFEE